MITRTLIKQKRVKILYFFFFIVVLFFIYSNLYRLHRNFFHEKSLHLFNIIISCYINLFSTILFKFFEYLKNKMIEYLLKYLSGHL